MRRVFARRRGTFHLADGTLAGWVHTDWVLIDARGALTRIPAIFREMFGARRHVGLGRPGAAAADARRMRSGRASRSGRTSWTRWPTPTTRSISTGWRRRSPPPAAAEAVAATPRRYRLEYALAAAGGR